MQLSYPLNVLVVAAVIVIRGHVDALPGNINDAMYSVSVFVQSFA